MPRRWPWSVAVATGRAGPPALDADGSSGRGPKPEVHGTAWFTDRVTEAAARSDVDKVTVRDAARSG